MLAELMFAASLLLSPPPQPAFYQVPGQPPLCRVEAIATPTFIPGHYTVQVFTVPDCPWHGRALVRSESVTLHPWREVRPGQPVIFRGVGWWWRIGWRAASGVVYTVSVPDLHRPPQLPGGLP